MQEMTNIGLTEQKAEEGIRILEGHQGVHQHNLLIFNRSVPRARVTPFRHRTCYCTKARRGTVRFLMKETDVKGRVGETSTRRSSNA